MVDGREIGKIRENVAEKERDKGKTDADDTKAPLLIHGGKRLQKGENEGVAEAGEKGQPRHNWFSEEHVERPVVIFYQKMLLDSQDKETYRQKMVPNSLAVSLRPLISLGP